MHSFIRRRTNAAASAALDQLNDGDEANADDGLDDDDDPDASHEAADEEIIDDIDGVHPPFAVSEDDIKTAQVALEKVCT